MSDERAPQSGDKRRIDARTRKQRIEARDLSAVPPESPAPSAPAAASSEAPPEPAWSARPTPREADRFPALPEEQRRTRRTRRSVPAVPRRRGLGWRDAVALLFLFGTCGLGGYFAYLWFNPYSVLNPLAPPLLPPLVISETPQPSATPAPSASPTRLPTATFTPLPPDQIAGSAVGEPSQGTPDLTATLLAGTPSATPPPPPFALLRNQALYITHAGAEGCNYSGIAGSVVGDDGQPLNGYTVWITGEDVDSRLVSGSSNLYGAGGFLVQVGTAPAIRAYAAQVLAADGVTPLSEPFTFLTRDTCEYNVALIRFVQVGALP